MKKTVSTLALAVTVVAAIFLTSCNSAKKEFIIKPQSTQVKGILGDYLQVKDGEYKFQKVGDDGKHWSVSIPLKRIKKPKGSCDTIT